MSRKYHDPDEKLSIARDIARRLGITIHPKADYTAAVNLLVDNFSKRETYGKISAIEAILNITGITKPKDPPKDDVEILDGYDPNKKYATPTAKLEDVLSFAKISITGIQFDLEATRRENQHLRKRIEDQGKDK